MKNVQVFIMTYNRPDRVTFAIDSVLSQSFSDFDLIVSDNSTNDLTKELINKKYLKPNFKYIKRNPSVGGIEHLNLILSEVNSNYFMIFHDDDVMHPNMLERLYNKMGMENSCIAVAGNAYIVHLCKKKRENRLFLKMKEDLLIHTADEMCIRYLTNNKILPFPSYLYRRDLLENVRFDRKEGGKYCDSTFIIKLLKYGPICFVSEPLMDYCEHDGQDSSSWAFLERNAQIKFILNHSTLTPKNPLILNFRIQNIYCELVGRGVNKISNKLFLKYSILFMKYSLTNYFLRLILKRLSII